MKNNKHLLCVVLPLLTASLLISCNQNKVPESSEQKPLEIGDTVREWTSRKDLDALPMDVKAATDGVLAIADDFGNEDTCSLKFEGASTSETYIGSDIPKTPYFIEDDAKNGDIISMYVYVPTGSDISSVQLQIYPISGNNPVKGLKINIDNDHTDKWFRLMQTYDSLETLGSIRLYYQTGSASKSTLYIDDINITYGAETVETDYEAKDESLYKTYEDYFKVGACMSAQMLQNTTLRKIAKDNFNSLTAENEAKPERVLDQTACQELAKTDEGKVAITVKPFEKLYDFCEANHIGVRHHTFVWYSQVPAWFFKQGYKDNGNNVSKEVMLRRMENFIRVMLQTVNDRWPGLVYAIDVANEAVDNHTIRNSNNNWYTVVGEDFVYYAFKYARMYAAPDQKLYYNDYSFDYDTQNCSYALNTLLKRAISENLIDGVGIQGHTDSNQDMTTIINDAKMIKEKGLECQITELDITVNGTSASEYSKQKDAYKNIITKVLKNNADGSTNITAVVVWGINDNASWKRNQYPLLFTDTYAKKPAYYGFLEAIDSVEPAENTILE